MPLPSSNSSLNLIPSNKIKEKIGSVLQACSICSQRPLEISQNIDGACKKCALTITLYNRYIEANLPVEYWPLKMDKDFVGDARLLTKYNELTADIKDTYCKGTSICFAGSNGLGKTMASVCLLKKACQKGYTCLYTDMYSIVSVLTQAPGEDKFIARKQLTLADFLVIDELDNRFFNQSDSSNNLFARTLESIIRTRLQNKLPLIIATNSPNIKESFQSLFKDSLSSLWNKIEVFSIMPGNDFRKNNGK